MKKFELQNLFEISGIGSASGLIYTNDKLYIISDNSTFLYQYNINKAKLKSINLNKESHQNIPKIIKPDFESIALKGHKLYLFGSGSTSNREQQVTYNLKISL